MGKRTYIIVTHACKQKRTYIIVTHACKQKLCMHLIAGRMLPSLHKLSGDVIHLQAATLETGFSPTLRRIAMARGRAYALSRRVKHFGTAREEEQRINRRPSPPRGGCGTGAPLPPRQGVYMWGSAESSPPGVWGGANGVWGGANAFCVKKKTPKTTQIPKTRESILIVY